MSVTAEDEPVIWEFTMRDIHELVKVAMGWPGRARFLDSDDRYEAAYAAICENLCAGLAKPTRLDLIHVGVLAISQASRDALRHHGMPDRNVTGNEGKRFAAYWQKRAALFPDNAICERLAVPAILAGLTDLERQAIIARAAFDTVPQAAAAVGVSEGTFNQRVTRARSKFAALWYDHETAPAGNKIKRGGCKVGHDPAVNRKQLPSGKWYCHQCKLDYKKRRRAKGKK